MSKCTHIEKKVSKEKYKYVNCRFFLGVVIQGDFYFLPYTFLNYLFVFIIGMNYLCNQKKSIKLTSF